jgi:YbbR domain-containing protein
MKLFKDYKSRINLFLLALLLWLFVITGREYEAVIDIPLVVTNIKPGKVVVNELPKKARVLFKGVGRGLFALKAFENAQLELDVSSINRFYEYPLKLQCVHIHSSLKLEPIELLYPDTVKIMLEDMEEKILPVIPQLELETNPGYVIAGEVKVVPAKISVRGPASIIKDLTFISTAKLSKTDLKRDFRQRVKIRLFHPGLSASVSEVLLITNVERLTEVKLRNIPISIKNPPRYLGVRLEPERINVKVKGAVSLIKNLKEAQISAVINFPQLWRGDITRCVPEILLPSGIELVDIDPDSVVMTLVRE